MFLFPGGYILCTSVGCFVWSWFHHVSGGPLGPPSHPADMNLGIMNDGSIADVYREHPVLWTYQTTGNGGEEWMGKRTSLMGGVGVTVFFPRNHASTVHGKQMKVNKLCCASWVFDVLIHFSDHSCCSLDSLRTVVMKRHLRRGAACNCKEYTLRKTNKWLAGKSPLFL